MRNNTLFFHITVLLIALLFVSCRHDESILLPEVVPTTQPEVAPTTQPEYTNITGFAHHAARVHEHNRLLPAQRGQHGQQ